MEFRSDFWKWFDARSKVQFYAIFITTWIALHWQSWVVLFFVSEESIFQKSGLLKVEYIKQHSNLIVTDNYWLNFIACVLISFIVAWVSIWFLPKWLLIKAYEHERRHEFSKEQVEAKIRKEAIKEEKSIVIAEEKLADAENKVAKTRAATKKTDKTVIWDREFEKFSKSNYFSSFNSVITAIYEYQGRWGRVSTDSQLLAYIDSLGLIELSINNIAGTNRQIIAPTEKGKYFIQKYNEKLSS